MPNLFGMSLDKNNVASSPTRMKIVCLKFIFLYCFQNQIAILVEYKMITFGIT
jgi:hypothetical protein